MSITSWDSRQVMSPHGWRRERECTPGDVSPGTTSIGLPHVLYIVARKCPELLRPLTSANKPPVSAGLDNVDNVASMQFQFVRISWLVRVTHSVPAIAYSELSCFWYKATSFKPFSPGQYSGFIQQQRWRQIYQQFLKNQLEQFVIASLMFLIGNYPKGREIQCSKK